jgi:putative DNA primase/helicase
MNTERHQATSSYIRSEHLTELEASAIDQVTANNNFYSLDVGDEEAANLLSEELNIEIDHNNNGFPSGTSTQKLVNALLSGGWGFEGHKGTSIKLDSPRTVDGKIIKYESVRGKGNQQLFIPNVSVQQALDIAGQLDLKREYVDTITDDQLKNKDAIDKGFWDWVRSVDSPITIIITEGAKKACSLISNGYLAIGLNGIWGWGTNVKATEGENADKYGNKLDEKGKVIKLIHPDLEPFLKKNIEIAWALDRDEEEKTIKDVEVAKKSFKTRYSKLVKNISDTAWEEHKGVDDLIFAEGVAAFKNAFDARSSKKVLPKATGKPSTESGQSDAEGDSESKTSANPFYLSPEGEVCCLKPVKGGEVEVIIGNYLVAIASIDNPTNDGSGLLLEFKTCKGTTRTWMMPRSLLGGDGGEIASELLAREYSFHYRQKSWLMAYLCSLGADIDLLTSCTNT